MIRCPLCERRLDVALKHEYAEGYGQDHRGELAEIRLLCSVHGHVGNEDVATGEVSLNNLAPADKKGIA